MAESFDAVVIGAGPNGLVAASCLAKAGMEVAVVEARTEPGGIASSVEFAPGFHGSVGPDLCLLQPAVIEELSLADHGLALHAPDPLVFAPTKGGEALTLWRDPAKTRGAIQQFSSEDADAYERFSGLVRQLATFLKPLATEAPPVPNIRGPGDALGFLKLGWDFHQLGKRSMHELLRTLPMSIADFLNEWFISEPLKACLAGPGIRGVSLGTRSAGTAANFLYHQLGEDPRPWCSERAPRGGMKALVGALVACAKANGARLRTGTRVTKVDVRAGTATGVVLDSGKEIAASIVVSSAPPRTTFFELIEPGRLEPGFVSEARAIRYRGVSAKLLFALSELPDFRARPGKDAAPHHQAVIHIGDSLDDLEKASDGAKYGEASGRPFLLATIPSLLDNGLAPPGQHVLSVTMQYAPYRLAGGSWREERASLAQTVVATLAEYAPNVPGAVVDHHVITPADYEAEFGLPEGSLHHGEMALDQMLFMRPVPGWAGYRTPLHRLYLCGSGTHPGGGVTGAPGYNASQVILKDR